MAFLAAPAFALVEQVALPDEADAFVVGAPAFADAAAELAGVAFADVVRVVCAYCFGELKYVYYHGSHYCSVVALVA